MGTFRKFLFIFYSRRPRGRLGVNQEKMGIIDQKILSCSPTVKGKFAGRIPIDNSSYDEYSGSIKEFGGTALRIAS
jgi:hypothetical protein